MSSVYQMTERQAQQASYSFSFGINRCHQQSIMYVKCRALFRHVKDLRNIEWYLGIASFLRRGMGGITQSRAQQPNASGLLQVSDKLPTNVLMSGW